MTLTIGGSTNALHRTLTADSHTRTLTPHTHNHTAHTLLSPKRGCTWYLIRLTNPLSFQNCILDDPYDWGIDKCTAPHSHCGLSHTHSHTRTPHTHTAHTQSHRTHTHTHTHTPHRILNIDHRINNMNIYKYCCM